MSFLDTIGQRGPESRPQSARPTIAQNLISDTLARPIQTPAAQEPQSDRVHALVIWSAALIVIAAVAVAAWLGVRHFGAVVTPAKEASTDTPPATQAPAEKPRPKRGSARPEAAGSSAAQRQIAIDAGPDDTRAEAASEASVVPAVGAATEVANVVETEAAPIEALADPIAASLLAELSEDNDVYSSEGTGVVAPRLLSLGFPPRSVNGFNTRTSTLALVVSKSGTVERAEISPPSRNWQDAMLLSRAKTFQFVPAQRNGAPVRYRLVMPVDTAP